MSSARSIVLDIDGETVVDIWGGWCDSERRRPWERDTITNVWSTTKTVTNLAALMLVDRGSSTSTRRWPTTGPSSPPTARRTIEVRHILSHTSGVSGWDTPFVVEDMYDWTLSTERLAAQAPWWEPGTASGYHANNQGHLVGEIVRRVTGLPLKRFVAEEIAGPLGADFQIGAAEDDWPRIAPVVPPPPLPIDLASLPTRRARCTRRSPARSPTPPTPTRPRGARPTWARSTGTPTPARWRASSRRCRWRGIVEGKRLLSPETIELIFDEQSHGTDLVLGVPLRFGIGFALPETETVPYVPQGRCCYWGGWGGSKIIADLDRRVTLAYMMNNMAPGIIGSDRSEAYVRAAYDCLS